MMPGCRVSASKKVHNASVSTRIYGQLIFSFFARGSRRPWLHCTFVRARRRRRGPPKSVCLGAPRSAGAVRCARDARLAYRVDADVSSDASRETGGGPDAWAVASRYGVETASPVDSDGSGEKGAEKRCGPLAREPSRAR